MKTAEDAEDAEDSFITTQSREPKAKS